MLTEHQQQIVSSGEIDKEGEHSLIEWYKKQGIGPELLVDMPLVRKIYMSNLHREVDKELKPKDTGGNMGNEALEVGEKDLLPQRYRGRRFSSFLSKEAQLASLGMYEDEAFQNCQEETPSRSDEHKDLDSAKVAERLQKAMHILDSNKEKD